MNVYEPKTCPCKWCGKPTRMLGTKECDPCHELRKRIDMTDPVLLAKILGLRFEVFAFARLMEEKLREHDSEDGFGKRGWASDDPLRLFRRLLQENAEMFEALMLWQSRLHQDPMPTARECADVANFAMMIADVVGGLKK